MRSNPRCEYEGKNVKKVILGESQALYRAGVARVLSVEDDFRIVAQCRDLDRLMPAVQTFRSSLVLVASALKPDYTDLVAKVRAADSRLIVLAEDTEPFLTFEVLGASAVLYRSTTVASFVDCLRQVHAGNHFVPPAAANLEEDLVGTRARAQLTPKEMKIVALIVEGMRNKQIAVRLNTTEQVIKNQLRSVYDKTGVSDRLELAMFTLHHRVLATAAAEISAALHFQTA